MSAACRYVSIDRGSLTRGSPESLCGTAPLPRLRGRLAKLPARLGRKSRIGAGPRRTLASSNGHLAARSRSRYRPESFPGFRAVLFRRGRVIVAHFGKIALPQTFAEEAR